MLERKPAPPPDGKGAGNRSQIKRRLRLVLGNLLGHLNRSGVLAVLGDFLLALDVSGAAATLCLLTMLLTHGGSVVCL